MLQRGQGNVSASSELHLAEGKLASEISELEGHNTQLSEDVRALSEQVDANTAMWRDFEEKLSGVRRLVDVTHFDFQLALARGRLDVDRLNKANDRIQVRQQSLSSRY